MNRPRPVWRDERGSAAIETVILAPALVLMILLVVFGGRVALAHQTVQTVAADAARAASLARTHTQAKTDAATALRSGFDQHLACTDHTLDLDLAGFTTPAGTPANVAATITCRVPAADLGLPVPAVIVISKTMTSPIDTYRERR